MAFRSHGIPHPSAQHRLGGRTMVTRLGHAISPENVLAARAIDFSKHMRLLNLYLQMVIAWKGLGRHPVQADWQRRAS